MNKDDKKIAIGVLKLLLFGAFCKVGFDIHTYLSIEDTMDNLKLVLLLVIAALLLVIIVVMIVLSVSKQKRIDKARRDNKRKVNALENQMMSTSNNMRRNGQNINNRQNLMGRQGSNQRR